MTTEHPEPEALVETYDAATSTIDERAARLALATVHQAYPDRIGDLNRAHIRGLFLAGCGQISSGDAERISPDRVAANILAAADRGSDVALNVAVARAIQLYLFYGGCGDSRYALDVRASVVSLVNELAEDDRGS